MAKAGRPKKRVAETKINNSPAKQAETKIVADNDCKNETTKAAESDNNIKLETSESFIEDLPRIVIETDDIPETVIEKSVSEVPNDKTTNPYVKEEVVPEKTTVTEYKKGLEYPASVVPIINRLKRQPGYSGLSDMALIRIASSKLRSRYFFS